MEQSVNPPSEETSGHDIYYIEKHRLLSLMELPEKEFYVRGWFNYSLL